MKIRLKPFFLIILLIALISSGTFFYRIFFESDLPQVELQPLGTFVTSQTTFTLNAQDLGSGIGIVQVIARQEENKKIILSQTFPGKTPQWAATFSLAGAKLKEGPFELMVSCTDKSWAHMSKGNTLLIEHSFVLDNQAPIINVLSHQHNIAIGGSGLVAYTLSEPAPKNGILIGDRFFPGFKDDASDAYFCFFAYPYDVDPQKDTPKIIATDAAGNEGRTGIYYHLIPKKFRHDNIRISKHFLEQKMPQFKALFPEENDLLQLFLKMNNEGRVKNRNQLYDLAAQTTPQILWKNAFIRQPGAANRATFGDKRSYLYDGKVIDHQRHLGVDLASVARDKVQACNAGVVVFADFLGIYGNVLIIDHGMGLQSLYAHLSQFLVKKGDTVERRQIIGRTGATGMAGGDHLHLGIILSGLPVNPVEWWDSHWIKNNITSKITTARKELGVDSSQEATK